MRITSKLASRLASLTLTAGVVGCATPWDPLDKQSTLPPVARSASQTASKNPTQHPPAEPGEVVQTSAPGEPAPVPTTFSADEVVRFALENNPMLQAVRLQRGVAQGGIVIGRTYPYNPVLQSVISGVSGAPSSGITNHTFNATTIRLDVEVRGQFRQRRAASQAVFTRTEWEIATQELATSVAAVRAFNTVVYRRRKLDLLEDTIRFNDEVAGVVKKLVDLGRLRPADLIVARTELDTARAQLGQGLTALAVARSDLRRQLGTLDDSFAVKGELDLPVPTTEFEMLAQAALEQRPDLQARKAMVAEAEARYRLQVADRFGNPYIGPAFELNETNDTFVGVTLGFPIPVFNTRPGEILQTKATLARTLAEVKQFEVQAGQDVQAALARLAEARKWVDSYKGVVLPNLLQAVKDMNKLLEQNDPGVDVIRVLSVQRNYLRAFDAYLDALFELSQARADLAAAVGDPVLSLGLYAPAEKPAPKPAPAPPKDKP